MDLLRIIRMSFLMCFLIILSGTLPAAAQYVGPNSVTTTVKQVLDSGNEYDRVTLKGFILKRIDKHVYQFTDGTGEINIKIEPEYWPSGLKIDEKIKVEISGKYIKYFFMQNIISVKEIRKIDKE